MFNVLGEWETPYGGSGNFFTGVLFNLFNPQPQTTLLELKDRHGWQVVSLGSGFSPAFAKPGSAQSGSSFSPPAPPCVSSFFIFYICSSLRIIFFYILYFLLPAYYLFLYFIFSPQKPGLLHGSGVPETIVDRLLKKGLEGVHCHLVRVLPKISFQILTHIQLYISVQVFPNIYSISMFTRASSFIRSNRRPRSTQPRVVCSCFRINSFSSQCDHNVNHPA